VSTRSRSFLVVFVVLAAAGFAFLAGGFSFFGLGGDSDPDVYRADGRYIGPPLPARKRPNLVVIILDTVRADCLGDGSAGSGDMPFLSSLAKSGVRCVNAVAPAPATYPSITSLLTGLLPDEHGVDHTPNPPRLPAGITTFAEALSKGHGYTTAAFMQVRLSNEGSGPLQGFQTVRAPAPLHAWREAIEKWNQEREQRKPFFLLLHTYEAHDPYGEANHPWPEDFPTPEDMERAARLGKSDKELVETFLTDRGARVALLEQNARQVFDRVFGYYGRGYGADPDPAMAARLETSYRKGVRWVDGQLEAAVTHLREQGLLENTLLVVTSDHGEAFGEHGILNHGRSLHAELVRVPVVLVGPPPFDTGRTIDTSLGIIDLLPTYFELAHLPPIAETSGRSALRALAGNEAGRAVLSLEDLSPFKMGFNANVKLASARTATQSYIVRYDVQAGTVIEALYDLTRDPGETDDLLAQAGRLGERPVSRALAEAIEAARDRIWTSVTSSQNHLQSGYGSGVATLSGTRPAPARVGP
jgi:arylsulfatase A-like enzyme